MIRVEHVMGTAVGVDVRDADVETDSFFSWLRLVDSRFSTYKPDSEISRLGRGDIGLDEVSEDVRDVLAMCEVVRLRSGDVFDVWAQRAAGGLDPSALVKGWSLERGARILTDAGATRFCINGGGDIVTRGEPEPGRPWRVGIRHPEQAHMLATVIEARDLAVATSGTYERGEHIIDPTIDRPPRGLLSMTVVGPSLTFADAYSTAAFAMGTRGIEWVAGLKDYSGYAITAERRGVWTDGFDRFLAGEAA